MAKPETLEVGNNHVIDDDSEFADGFSNGYLYYYDTNHQLPRPLSCQMMYTFMRGNLSDQRASERWNAGFVFGWITALSESRSDYFFTSIVLSEILPVTEPLSLVVLPEA